VLQVDLFGERHLALRELPLEFRELLLET
jgi:hypothetical protein